MIGIGIITYNRVSQLKRVFESVINCTKSPFALVVADDGSTDGTHAFLRDNNVTMVGGINRGIAWNKNRAIYTLRQYANPEFFIILEDDTLPYVRGWESIWAEAVEKFGYATYAHPKVLDSALKGSGTPQDPYGCTKITSQCAAVSRAALDGAGYFDTAFKGYGVEDGEWSTRLRSLDYGIIKVDSADGTYVKANAMIEGGVLSIDSDTYRDNDSVAKNRELFAKIRNDPMPRMPWRSADEEFALKNEASQSVARCPLVIRSSIDLN